MLYIYGGGTFLRIEPEKAETASLPPEKVTGIINQKPD